MTPPLPLKPFPSGTATLHFLLTTAIGAGTSFGLGLYLNGQQRELQGGNLVQAALTDTAMVTFFGFYFGVAGLWMMKRIFERANAYWPQQPQRAKRTPFAAILSVFTFLEVAAWCLPIDPAPRHPFMGHLPAMLVSWEVASLLAGVVVVRIIPKAA